MTYYNLKRASNSTARQSKHYGVVKLAQDIHAHFAVSALQEEGQQPQAPRKRTLQEHLKWVADLAARSEKVYSCYEAGPTGFSLHRQLRALGVENIVVAPRCLDEQGKRVNNDKTDTLQLSGRLDRHVAGNKKMFTVVRVPSLAEEQRRLWPRQRKQLQAQRLSLASQGRSLVLTQGIAISNLWWRPARWKELLGQLPSWLMKHLEIFRRIILVVDEEIKDLENRIEAQHRAQSNPRPKYCGENTLEVIEAEVCDWNRFSCWRKAGSYSGLTGGVSASGQFHRDLSITKRGNRRLRTALIELAWRMVYHQPDYWLTKKWARVLDPGAKAHRRLRKKAIVAYARALFVDLWKWKTGRISPQRLGWQMC